MLRFSQIPTKVDDMQRVMLMDLNIKITGIQLKFSLQLRPAATNAIDTKPRTQDFLTHTPHIMGSSHISVMGCPHVLGGKWCIMEKVWDMVFEWAVVWATAPCCSPSLVPVMAATLETRKMF